MKVSHENINSCYLNFFAIVQNHSICAKFPNYPATVFIGTACKLWKKKKESYIHSSAHVLHKALNSVILHCCFAKDDEEMYQNVKHTFFYDALVVGCHSCVTSHVNATWTVTKRMPHEKIWAFFLPLVKLPSLLRWSFIHQNESFDRSSQRSTWIRRVSHPHYPCFLDQSLFD